MNPFLVRAQNSLKKLPPLPGTSPIKSGWVRLYHQTDADSLKSIEKTGLTLDHAKGIEGPKAIYASESGFYGEPDKVPTLEFKVERKMWDSPFVLRDVSTKDIIAAHYPWHNRARYILSHPETMKEVMAGEHDDLQGDYKDAIQFVKAGGHL